MTGKFAFSIIWFSKTIQRSSQGKQHIKHPMINNASVVYLGLKNPPLGPPSQKQWEGNTLSLPRANLNSGRDWINELSLESQGSGFNVNLNESGSLVFATNGNSAWLKSSLYKSIYSAYKHFSTLVLELHYIRKYFMKRLRVKIS